MTCRGAAWEMGICIRKPVDRSTVKPVECFLLLYVVLYFGDESSSLFIVRKVPTPLGHWHS